MSYLEDDLKSIFDGFDYILNYNTPGFLRYQLDGAWKVTEKFLLGFMSRGDILFELYKRTPIHFDLKELPYWFYGCGQMLHPICYNTTTFKQLHNSLQVKELTIEQYADFMNYYFYILRTISSYMSSCKSPVLFFDTFRGERQQIAEFSLMDKTIPRENQYNWHGQNTSQWKFAGCLLYQDGRFSIHT